MVRRRTRMTYDRKFTIDAPFAAAPRRGRRRVQHVAQRLLLLSGEGDSIVARGTPFIDAMSEQWQSMIRDIQIRERSLYAGWFDTVYGVPATAFIVRHFRRTIAQYERYSPFMATRMAVPAAAHLHDGMTVNYLAQPRPASRLRTPGEPIADSSRPIEAHMMVQTRLHVQHPARCGVITNIVAVEGDGRE